MAGPLRARGARCRRGALGHELEGRVLPCAPLAATDGDRISCLALLGTGRDGRDRV